MDRYEMDEYIALDGVIKNLERELAEARAQIAAKDAASNRLVLEAYPAMDAVDAIRKWCDGQEYENDTITVARLRGLLPHTPAIWNPEVMAALGASKFTEGEYQQTDYNEPIDDAGHVVGDGLKAELAEARAQIAVKDAALMECRSYVLNRPDPSNVRKRFTLIRDIDIALAAPARETE